VLVWRFTASKTVWKDVSGLGGVSISIVLTDEVKHVQSIQFIIDTLRDGYKIPFYSSSPSVYLSNNMSGSKNASFVDTVLQNLLHRDLIVLLDK
jgi:hypothetical protein